MTNPTFYRSYQMRINPIQQKFDNVLSENNFFERVSNAFKIKRIEFFIHLLVWAFLYFLPSWLFLKTDAGLHVFLSDAADPNRFVLFALLIGFVYLDHYYMVPLFCLGKKLLLYFSFI